MQLSLFNFFFLFPCLSVFISSTVSSLNSNGVALLSLYRHWTSVPASVSSSWNASDSNPCQWAGIECDQSHNVVTLKLTGYQIFGPLGPEVGSLRSLQTLALSGNLFYGKIPRELANCSLLEYLDLAGTGFFGEIPEPLFEIPALAYVYLSENNLNGSIPGNVGNMSELVHLDLIENQFSGMIPSSIGNCSKLKELLLGRNRLKGELPKSLNNLENLVYLGVNHNRLEGSIPLGSGKCKSLYFLDLSHNYYSGGIPSGLGNCSNLTQIFAAGAKLRGVIPQELGNLADLRTLILFGNNLVGPLPSQLSNCTKLDKFDVGSNLLNGSIPSGLRSWRRLAALILSDNRFTGEIPPFLAELEMLVELQLGGNLLGGVIPSSIGMLQNLFYALNLSHNALTGPIPSELGKLKRLRVLDISHNNLTGTLEVLDEMHLLDGVNISYNNFTGRVSDSLMDLLNSSPSSFFGNSYLCVNYIRSRSLNCTGSNNLKPFESQSSNRQGLSKVQIAFIALGSSVLLVIVLCGLVYRFLFHVKNKQYSGGVGQSSLLYEVMVATENLKDQYIIGTGAHGTVYKASLGPGKVFAVKKLVFAEHDEVRLSMVREIQTLGKIRHRNLVKLEDFWFVNDYGLILYRYMQNGSLHGVLHEISPPPTLEWKVRYKIALGAAYGLEYIHYDCDPPIVHRDIKPMNILLDSEMEPHIADFGIAKLLDSSSSLSTSVVGTIGYIAPERAFGAAKSKESDVYSYGVVLLELMTRKKALDPSFMDQTGIVGWVKSIWSNTEEIDRILDPSLVEELLCSNIMKQQVVNVLLVALRSTDKDPRRRPTMRDVTKQLLDAIHK